MKNERTPPSHEPRRTLEVDMSPEAIDRRMRDVGQLYKLGMSLARARRIGKVEDRRGHPPSPAGKPGLPDASS